MAARWFETPMAEELSSLCMYVLAVVASQLAASPAEVVVELGIDLAVARAL
jgi:hypothetical protein